MRDDATRLQTLRPCSGSTDQSEVVALHLPDQTGLLAVPLLYVHQLSIFNGNNGLQEAKEHQENASDTWERCSVVVDLSFQMILANTPMRKFSLPVNKAAGFLKRQHPRSRWMKLVSEGC